MVRPPDEDVQETAEAPVRKAAKSSIWGNLAPKPCCMEDLASALRVQGLSEDTIKLYMLSWKGGTTKQYNVYLEKWTRYCVEHKVHPAKPTVHQVMEFCTYLYKQKLSYSAINSARSALSAYVHKIDGVTIGKHPEICRHLRGISVARPNKGKHTYTWDADIVLSLLKTWHPLENLSYKQLAYKTLMLMALATAQRMQTLHAFNVDRIHFTGDEAILFVDKPLKHTKQGSPLDVFHVFKYSDKRLCPFRALRAYLDRTSPMRTDKLRQLWLSVAGNDHAKTEITTQTMAQWIKSMMTMSGITPGVYSAHSTRGAATSKAHWAALPAEIILRQARWTNAVTFARFYKRPILQKDGASFQETVLTVGLPAN